MSPGHLTDAQIAAQRLSGCCDPAVWAEEFVREFGPCFEKVDAELMTGWFGHAILAGANGWRVMDREGANRLWDSLTTRQTPS